MTADRVSRLPTESPTACGGIRRTFRWSWEDRCTSCCAGRIFPTTRSVCSAAASSVIALFAWLPLLVLSALGGRLLGGGVAVPFLMDVDVHVKFLVVIPLLVGAELVVHQRMRTLATTFRDRSLIPENAEARLDAAIASAYRLRNSTAPRCY